MNELIYNQKKIPKEKWRYGLRSSAATGCGWIATHNALRLLGYQAEPKELIRYYERQFPLINGNMGTVLFGPAIFFKQKGFQVKMILRRNRFDERVKKSDVCILFYYWHRKFRFGSHFVTVQYQDGQFVGYNTFSNSAGPDRYGDSLEKFLKTQKYFGTILISVNDMRKTKKI